MADPDPPPPSEEELDRELAALVRQHAQRGAALQTMLASWRFAYAFLLATWIREAHLNPAAAQAFLLQSGEALAEDVVACLQDDDAPDHDDA